MWLKSVHLDLIHNSIMELATSSPAKSNFGLFDNVPEDYLQFGRGASFDAKQVSSLLNLKKEDVSRIASVSVSSVRYDDHIPQSVRQHLEEIANTINMVAGIFQGDIDRTVAWFKASNPLLGDVSPRDMIRLGRYERLRKFIVNASIGRRDQPAAKVQVAASA